MVYYSHNPGKISILLALNWVDIRATSTLDPATIFIFNLLNAMKPANKVNGNKTRQQST